MGSGLVVTDLVKVYRIDSVEVQALRGLRMEVEEGEIVSIIGPSGSGKTTLLNIIGGLSRATAGSVKVGEIEVTVLNDDELTEYRRKTVGHIFQTSNLIPTLTAAENIELPMIAAKVSKGRRTKRVEELLQVMDLEDRRKHRPGELSGGEQQRIAIASALANDPGLILADEPTGELDTSNSKIVVDYLRRVNADMRKTIVMVTHDPVVARVGNRIFKIEDGEIKATHTPTQISAEERAVTFADHVRMRIDDINVQLRGLDDELKDGRISGDEYFTRKLNLTHTLNVYKDELHRLGMVP